MLTAPSASTPSWSSRIVARVAQAYGVSPATLVSRRRDPLLVEARRVVMGLVAERGLGPCWIGKVLHRDHRTVLHHLVVLRPGRSAEEQEMLSDLRVSIRSAPSPDPQGGRVRTEHSALPLHGQQGPPSSPRRACAARRRTMPPLPTGEAPSAVCATACPCAEVLTRATAGATRQAGGARRTAHAPAWSLACGGADAPAAARAGRAVAGAPVPASCCFASCERARVCEHMKRLCPGRPVAPPACPLEAYWWETRQPARSGAIGRATMADQQDRTGDGGDRRPSPPGEGALDRLLILWPVSIHGRRKYP